MRQELYHLYRQRHGNGAHLLLRLGRGDNFKNDIEVYCTN